MANENARRMVVVTGASSGIGRAIALCLARAGYTVFAGVRSDAAAEELRAEGVTSLIPLQLDVSDAESIERAFQQVRAQALATGHVLHAVINNAAVCITGPLESIPMSALQEQFTVNLFGGVAVTQAALPLLLESQGRIVNIGSNVGRVPSPFLGPYAATKLGLEALSDTWRRELKASGVQVSLIVPGPVMTPVWDKIDRSARESMARSNAAIRARYEARLDKFLVMNRQTAVRSRTSADDVAEVVLRCVSAKSPAHRYEIGPEARLATALSRAVPSSWIDRLLDQALRPRDASTSLGRPLGGLERVYYYFNRWSSNSVVAVCELDGVIDPALIQRALPRALARHPLLHFKVSAAEGGAQPRFVPRTGDSELLALETWPSLDCRALVTREMNARIDAHSALIRVVYARDRQRSALVVSLLHIVADAKSAMLVLRDLLAAAEAAKSGEAFRDSQPAFVVPDPPEARLPAAVRGAAGIPLIARN
ncbi:MAG TPA: SDR family NAD(P)-dependent oxidoreductase, partial [Polyangiales bacterium]|nr:SDR family NAD(P)-dependent oxidoreductase [Polyangiales bacterium]